LADGGPVSSRTATTLNDIALNFNNLSSVNRVQTTP
jgi:hypothetical protein